MSLFGHNKGLQKIFITFFPQNCKTVRIIVQSTGENIYGREFPAGEGIFSTCLVFLTECMFLWRGSNGGGLKNVGELVFMFYTHT